MIFLNIDVKQVLLFILGIVILVFLVNFFAYILLFAFIIWLIYMIYKNVKPYIKSINKREKTKKGKIIIEAKYKEK